MAEERVSFVPTEDISQMDPVLSLTEALRQPRIAIEAVSPSVDRTCSVSRSAARSASPPPTR